MSVSLEKVRFLVVDDNLHVINIVKTVLRGLGAMHVFDARSPKEALERLRNDAIDIVILDYMLGERTASSSCVACAPIPRARRRTCR